jgi:hypothetical protein
MRRRGTIQVGGVLVITVIQIAYEDVLVYLGATGGPTPVRSPFVLVAIPLLIFWLLAGLLFGWAILGSDTLR